MNARARSRQFLSTELKALLVAELYENKEPFPVAYLSLGKRTKKWKFVLRTAEVQAQSLMCSLMMMRSNQCLPLPMLRHAIADIC